MFLLSGCGHFVDLDAPLDVRIEVQVHDAAGASVEARHYGVEAARGTTDDSGRLEPRFEAVLVAPTTARGAAPWVSLTVRKNCFADLELPLSTADFVQEGRRYRLTRGLQLRRLS